MSTEYSISGIFISPLSRIINKLKEGNMILRPIFCLVLCYLWQAKNPSWPYTSPSRKSSPCTLPGMHIRVGTDSMSGRAGPAPPLLQYSESRLCTSPGQHNRDGLSDIGSAELALRIWEQESWLCPLSSAVLDELAGTVLESLPGYVDAEVVS